MKADQNDTENLAVLLANAGCTYVMGIPHGDDIMLNYQCASYHDVVTLRQLCGKKAIPEFQEWMRTIGILDENDRITSRFGDASIFC